jgi:hypothetical protein
MVADVVDTMPAAAVVAVVVEHSVPGAMEILPLLVVLVVDH